jgi:hypothetical protein
MNQLFYSRFGTSTATFVPRSENGTGSLSRTARTCTCLCRSLALLGDTEEAASKQRAEKRTIGAMERMNPEHADPDSSDRSLPADILLREEPEDEEDEGT